MYICISLFSSSLKIALRSTRTLRYTCKLAFHTRQNFTRRRRDGRVEFFPTFLHFKLTHILTRTRNDLQPQAERTHVYACVCKRAYLCLRECAYEFVCKFFSRSLSAARAASVGVNFAKSVLTRALALAVSVSLSLSE